MGHNCPTPKFKVYLRALCVVGLLSHGYCSSLWMACRSPEPWPGPISTSHCCPLVSPTMCTKFSYVLPTPLLGASRLRCCRLGGVLWGHPPAPPSSYALKRHGSHRLLFTPKLTTTYMTGGARHQPSRLSIIDAWRYAAVAVYALRLSSVFSVENLNDNNRPHTKQYSSSQRPVA